MNILQVNQVSKPQIIESVFINIGRITGLNMPAARCGTASGSLPNNFRGDYLDHRNLKAAERAPLVTQFDLPSLRGIVLLKEGRKVGNQDNL